MGDKKIDFLEGLTIWNPSLNQLSISQMWVNVALALLGVFISILLLKQMSIAQKCVILALALVAQMWVSNPSLNQMSVAQMWVNVALALVGMFISNLLLNQMSIAQKCVFLAMALVAMFISNLFSWWVLMMLLTLLFVDFSQD